jgi:hypothetical protein
MPDGCYCTECLRKLGPDREEVDEFGRDGLCPLCRQAQLLWQRRRLVCPVLPEGWRPSLTDEVRSLLACLLAHVRVPVGGPTGRVITGAVVTVEGLWVETTEGIVHLAATEVCRGEEMTSLPRFVLEDLMTNRELLRMAKEELSSLERQRQTLLLTALLAVPCPACHRSLNCLEAAGIDIDAYDLGRTALRYTCPDCGAHLEQVVPLLSAGSPWHWALDHDWLAQRLSKAACYDRDHTPEEP